MTKIFLTFYENSDAPALEESGEIVNLLVAIPELERYEAVKDRLRVDRFLLDSGAFTVFFGKAEISYDDWKRAAIATEANDGTFALDVIGDAAQSAENFERAIEEGIDCIPTFHYGSDFEELRRLASIVPRIGLGGMARVQYPQRRAWIRRCFSEVWPRRFHGFGLVDPRILREFPFDSVDATSWSLKPSRFGDFRGLEEKKTIYIPKGGRSVPRRIIELRYFKRFERELESRWRKTLEKAR